VSRGFCVVLLATSFYCFISATRVMIRLRSLRGTDPAQQFAHIEMSSQDSMLLSRMCGR